MFCVEVSDRYPAKLYLAISMPLNLLTAFLSKSHVDIVYTTGRSKADIAFSCRYIASSESKQIMLSSTSSLAIKNKFELGFLKKYRIVYHKLSNKINWITSDEVPEEGNFIC